MPVPRKLIPPRFIPYREARTRKPPIGESWIDVSSGGESPWDEFSPFHPHGGIPIPGMPGVTSDSVEGIWQGLKVIRGQTAPRFFEGGGRKRGGGKPQGHQFGDESRLLKLEEARRKIYIPAYEWMLENCIQGEMIDEVITKAFQGITQCFYDREDNGSMGKDQPLAHAKVLVDWLRRRIQEQLQPTKP